MKKRRRNILLFLAILITLFMVILGYCYVNNNKDEVFEENNKVLDKIGEYGYTLEDRDNQIYKDKYNELKHVLNKDEIDYEEYAKKISELYIIDLYSLNNKLNKYDVGGSEFVYESIRENYELNVKDTLYKYLEDNFNGKREQVLPEVIDVEIVDLKESSYSHLETEYKSYEVSLSWTYEEELDYDKEATVITILHSNKLYVVEQK